MRVVGVFLAVVAAVKAQEDVYGQYMQQQQQAAPAKQGGGVVGMAVAAGAGVVAGAMSPSLFGGGKNKKKIEQLYKVISMKNVEIQKLNTMVYEYEYQNQELKQALYESEQEALQRDYEEFKQPDANGDDVISRNEFSAYIRNYMKAYPHIPPEEYPTFEDFDMNRDGLVTFQEWQEYLYQQQLAEQQQQKAGGYDARGQQQATAAHTMYDQTSGAQNFQALYDQLQGQLKQQQAQQQYRRS